MEDESEHHALVRCTLARPISEMIRHMLQRKLLEPHSLTALLTTKITYGLFFAKTDLQVCNHTEKLTRHVSRRKLLRIYAAAFVWSIKWPDKKKKHLETESETTITLCGAKEWQVLTHQIEKKHLKTEPETTISAMLLCKSTGATLSLLLCRPTIVQETLYGTLDHTSLEENSSQSMHPHVSDLLRKS